MNMSEKACNSKTNHALGKLQRVELDLELEKHWGFWEYTHRVCTDEPSLNEAKWAEKSDLVFAD